MAWINGNWLEYEERQDLINDLEQLTDELGNRISSLSADDLEDLDDYITQLERLRRVHRAETDVAYFAYEYFSDDSNPVNDDNIVRHEGNRKHDSIEDMAPIHREFFDLCNYVVNDDPTARLAIAAARGHNKSGTFSNILPLHAVAFRLRKFILILSETDSLSKKLVGFINKQLKHNEKLRQDFGPLLNPSSNKNEKDNEDSFITSSGTLVEASSSGKQLRGKRHGSQRVDMAIIDDPSSLNNEGTLEAREKLIHWFNSVCLPIGQSNTAFIVVGTMVSASGLLNHVLNRKDFRSSFHGAIISEPNNLDLWDEYCKVYAQAEDVSEADIFYEDNKEKLESGVIMAWPWRWTYRKLMHEKVNMGNRAFSSEYLNKAVSDDELIFDPSKWTYYNPLEIEQDKLTFYAAWDLAFTKNRRSDYNAIVTVARDNRTGVLYVWDVWAQRCRASEALNVALKKIQEFEPKFFGVETVQAQVDLANQLQEKAMNMKLYHTAFKFINSRTKKSERIESLQPLFENGVLQVRKSQNSLIDQAESYPGDHDDILDATNMSVELASRQRKRRTYYQKPVGL